MCGISLKKIEKLMRNENSKKGYLNKKPNGSETAGLKKRVPMCGIGLNLSKVNKKAQHHELPGRLNQFRL